MAFSVLDNRLKRYFKKNPLFIKRCPKIKKENKLILKTKNLSDRMEINKCCEEEV